MTGNNLRVNLYDLLIPSIIEADQQSGAHGIVTHWGEFQWASAADLATGAGAAWAQIGAAPIIQELFYVIETMAGEQLAVLESLDDLLDAAKAPASMLPIIARSFGYNLSSALSTDEQRRVVSGLIAANKTRGQRIGYNVFFRLAGFQIQNVYELFKHDIYEANNDYSRERYLTAAVTGQSAGPSGQTAFAGVIGQAPLKPNSTQFKSTGVVVSEIDGQLVYGDDVIGTMNPATGEYQMTFPVALTAPLTVDFEVIVDEYPYHAARIDVEIILNPGLSDHSTLTVDRVDQTLTRLTEVSPVHVLLRALTFVYDIEDVVSGFAVDDGTDCVDTLTIVEDPVADPATLGETTVVGIDAGSARSEDDVTINYLDGAGALTERRDLLVDKVCFGPVNNDTLVVDTEGSIPSVEGMY